MYKDIIGVVGMGSYATADFFRRLLLAFPAVKEWDRPQIIVNNNCTMPSRVRAILYDENVEQLKTMLADCVRGILACAKAGGADAERVKIIIDCNTAHLFMPYLREAVPDAVYMDIIEACTATLKKDEVRECFIMASEGTIEARLYERYFEPEQIVARYPSEEGLREVRCFIESIKQNKMSEEVLARFEEMIRKSPCKAVVLGCTELPVLYTKLRERIRDREVYDPMECVMERLRREMV